MKRIFSIIVSVLLSLAFISPVRANTVIQLPGNAITIPLPTTPSYVGTTFQDVPTNSMYYEAVEYLAAHNIISTASNYYRPQQAVTRGQLAKMLARLLQLNTSNVPTLSFQDVPASHEFYIDIAALVRETIITGYADGRFGLYDPVKRSQMAKMLAKGFRLPDRIPPQHQFKDLQVGSETYTYATRLKFYDITVVESFLPNEAVTRGQLALFLMRAHKMSKAIEHEQTLLLTGRADAAQLLQTTVVRDPSVAFVKVDTKANAVVVAPLRVGSTYAYNPASPTSKSIVIDSTKFLETTVNVENVTSRYYFKQPYTVKLKSTPKTIQYTTAFGTTDEQGMKTTVTFRQYFSLTYPVPIGPPFTMTKIDITYTNDTSETLYVMTVVDAQRELLIGSLATKGDEQQVALHFEPNLVFDHVSLFEMRRGAIILTSKDAYTESWNHKKDGKEQLMRIQLFEEGQYTVRNKSTEAQYAIAVVRADGVLFVAQH